MTISTTTISKSYSGNGSTHSFAYDFKIFADADLTVIIRSSTGVETVKTLNTHYIVTGAGVSSGGTVLFKFNTGNASDAHYSTSDFRPASGETVVIRSELANTQTMDLVANDPFPAETLETNMDKLVRMVQQHDEELGRALKLSRTNTMTSTEFTTSATDRASKLIAFDTAGELSIAQEIGVFKGNWAASTAYVDRDIVKDTSTNNIFIVNTAHTSSGSQPLTTNANSAKYSLLVDAASATTSQNAAAASASSASTSASTATTKAAEAATSATNAANTLSTFQNQYHGAASSDPTSNLDTGDLYFNTSSGMKVYNGSAFEDVKPTSSEQTNINTVAGISSNVTTVAGKASLITSAFSNGMSLVTADFVSDVNTLAVTDVINDINLLATSDIVSDLNQLATSDIISDLNAIAVSDIISDLNTLAVSDVISDINTLATSDIVTDLNLLATSDFVSDLNTMATTTNVNNLSTVAGANSNISTVSGSISNVNTVASANSNIGTVASAIANVNTTAANIAGVNSFAERYRVGSSEPTSSLDAGDLFFNTSTNELRAYNGSAFQATSPSSSDQTNINIVAGEITAQEDLGSITQAVATSSGNNINTVASDISNVNTVAGISANVATVAGISSNVTTVAGIASNVTSVAGNSSNINSAVSNASNINSVVSNASNINTVAGISSDVTAVADNSSNINSAVSNASNINAAVSNATNINSVASNATNINTVASNISGVNSFAERYRVASSAPTSSLDAGDLYYDTTANTLNYYTGSAFQAVVAGAMTSLLVDTTPQLGGNLDVNGNAIVSASNGNIAITPNGSGKVILDGLSHPTSDGSAGQFLKTDGGGNLSFATVNTDLSNDSSPQLAANLDVNGNSIISASNGDITIAPNGSGEINLNGTVNTDNLTIDFGSIA